MNLKNGDCNTSVGDNGAGSGEKAVRVGIICMG